MGYETASTCGPFHAARGAAGAEAWLGRQRLPMTWPADWSVRFDPVELIDPAGEVFAREGEILTATGGLDIDDAFAVRLLKRGDTMGIGERRAWLRRHGSATNGDPAS